MNPPVSNSWICVVISRPTVPNSGTRDQVITARAGVPGEAANVLKNTPAPAPAGSRSSHRAAMLGPSCRKADSTANPDRLLPLLAPSQMKPLSETAMELMGLPPGPGNVKPSGWLADTVSFASCRLVPRLVSKQGTCAVAAAPNDRAQRNAGRRDRMGWCGFRGRECAGGGPAAWMDGLLARLPREGATRPNSPLRAAPAIVPRGSHRPIPCASGQLLARHEDTRGRYQHCRDQCNQAATPHVAASEADGRANN